MTWPYSDRFGPKYAGEQTLSHR